MLFRSDGLPVGIGPGIRLAVCPGGDRQGESQCYDQQGRSLSHRIEPFLVLAAGIGFRDGIYLAIGSSVLDTVWGMPRAAAIFPVRLLPSSVLTDPDDIVLEVTAILDDLGRKKIGSRALTGVDFDPA